MTPSPQGGQARPDPLPGGTLAARLDKMHDGLSAPAAARVLMRMLAGLEDPHNRGRFHGDIHPGSVEFRDVTWTRPVLRKFGRAAGSFPEPTIYQPAEQLRSPASAGPQADVFAIAVIGWELLLGCSPFVGDTEDEILESIRADYRYDWPDDIPAELTHVLDWAMARDLKHRYRTATQFADELEPVLASLASTAVEEEDDECTERVPLSDVASEDDELTDGDMTDGDVTDGDMTDAGLAAIPSSNTVAMVSANPSSNKPAEVAANLLGATIDLNATPDAVATVLDDATKAERNITLMEAPAAPTQPQMEPESEPEPMQIAEPPRLARLAPSIQHITNDVELSTLRGGVTELYEPPAWHAQAKAAAPFVAAGTVFLGIIITMAVAMVSPPIPTDGTPFQTMRRHHGVGGDTTRDARYELLAIPSSTDLHLGSWGTPLPGESAVTANVARFGIGSTEVTQGLWVSVMGDNPMSFRGEALGVDAERPCSKRGVGDRLPVACISFREALEFCNKLSIMDELTPAYQISSSRVTWKADADGYRLPTEAEWEAAARGGITSPWAPAEADGEQCIYGNVETSMNPITAVLRLGMPASCRSAFDGLAPVAAYQPNKAGIFDTMGNVAEWVWDPYVKDGLNPEPPHARSLRQRTVIRGGRWGSPGRQTRPADRQTHDAQQWSSLVGFRIARSL